MTNFGLRYERLLLFAAPLTVAGAMLFIVAEASSNQREKVQAKCLLAVADVIQSNEKTLTPLAEAEAGPSTREFWGIEYKHAMAIALIGRVPQPCYNLVEPQRDSRFNGTPSVVEQRLRADAAKLNSGPFRMYGVEVPETATTNILGTELKVSTASLTGLIQLVLCPLLMLWLGSLFNTRYRETLQTRNASSLFEVFPHAINIYPAGQLPEPRKHSVVARFVRPTVFVVYTLARLTLLLIFLAPPIALYEASLAARVGEDDTTWPIVLGALVAIFLFSNLLLEAFPWHSKRFFSFKILERV